MFGPVRGWRKLCFNMNKRKEPPSKQPGIDRFFSKSQRSDGNEESHKTAGGGGRQIPAITASTIPYYHSVLSAFLIRKIAIFMP